MRFEWRKSEYLIGWWAVSVSDIALNSEGIFLKNEKHLDSIYVEQINY